MANRLRRGSALAVIAAAAATVLAGCGHQQASAKRPSGQIRFLVAGVGVSGVRVGYIASYDRRGGPPPLIVLSRDARLPYQTMRGIDPTAMRYSLNAGLLGKGHITCMLRVGRVRAIGHADGPDTLCVANLQWSARLGRWVNSAHA